MNVIARTKWGDCTECPSKNVACIKRGKNLICIPCVRRIDGKQQIEKANEREKLRRGGNTKSIAKRTGTSLRKLAVEEPGVRAGKDYEALDAWFKERRKEMVGVCTECGKTTSKNNDKYYKWSICHIVPKSLIPSVATNEYNWIELCQQHHQEFDNTFDRAAAMMCFGEVKMKFQIFQKLIPPQELRKVNPHLLT